MVYPIYIAVTKHIPKRPDPNIMAGYTLPSVRPAFSYEDVF